MAKLARSNGENAAADLLEGMRLRVILLAAAIVALYALHQDLWFWRTARPLVFGFLPVGLAYHGAYCIAAALLMWALTTLVWPSHLEE
jgi:hypothetical protein